MSRRSTWQAIHQKETAGTRRYLEPFISRDLRPDLRYAPLLREPDLFEAEADDGDRGETAPCTRS